jgi:hypothetical protein
MVKLPIFEVNLKPIKNYIAGAPQPAHHWCSGVVRAPTVTSSLRWHVDVQTRPKFRRTGACSGSTAWYAEQELGAGLFEPIEQARTARQIVQDQFTAAGKRRDQRTASEIVTERTEGVEHGALQPPIARNRAGCGSYRPRPLRGFSLR